MIFYIAPFKNFLQNIRLRIYSEPVSEKRQAHLFIISTLLYFTQPLYTSKIYCNNNNNRIQ